MWSGPRNVSTAMMRSFENRADCTVVDEPFYAAYLAQTGLDHPMRDEVLAAQPQDWRAVVAALDGLGGPVVYEKHMTHHMLPGVGLDWAAGRANAFLIRDPTEVLASYTVKRAEVTLDDIGFVQQRELFDREADRLGRAPPVVRGADVLADPRGMLSALCTALGISFDEAMLEWPAGRRDSDGVWAPAWYDAVERSTGFEAPREKAAPVLDDHLRRIADAARPHYDALLKHSLSPG
ncbi:MAG: sulfotransferase [Alphaproteobacteria bacterium]|nr:sulfotransferase [Alphaproteobacteria bacterium]MBU1517246.1 sulfotransferase [Alphaproteobacteria bacterium]MBU2093218.1 sulfotransferase [Alphaproteobacteria bacterium]MBU2153156.1 sulfotransferase [Alphaproteobacteria bacterium]MBU2307862.1 sulfotransferase [Alphaproteobacteria bacterium]